MKTFLIALLLVQLPLTTQSSSGEAPSPREGGLYLEPTRPTVYLSAERVDEGGALWLRLHNNTKLAIHVRLINRGPEAENVPFAFADGRTGEGLADGAKVELNYLVESPLFEKYPLREHRSCERADAWLPSGHTLIFSIGRTHLTRFCEVSVGFNYEWENLRVEPEHRASLTWDEGGRTR